MHKKIRLHIALSIIAILWIFYADNVRKKPINWYQSFNSQHKMPYGTYVLRNVLPEFIQNSDIRDVNQAPYIKLKDSTLIGTYFFVNNAINFGKEEMNELLEFVERGNDVFISTLGANVDTLNLKTQSIRSFNLKEQLKLKLSNPSLDTLPVAFKNDLARFGFKRIDSTKTEILGKIRIYDESNSIDVEKINFVRQKFGKGYFYFHLYPYAFTNYFMLKDSSNAYAASALSYIDYTKPLLWDRYYKTGKSRIASPMYYVLSSKNLKWAYYSALIGVLIFVLFQGKRNQRNIPIISPLKNQTIAFTKTLSNLYFERKDHKIIAEKHIFHFLDFIRNQLNITTHVINDIFYDHVSSRSGNSIEDVKKLFSQIDKIQNQESITKEELIAINTRIESFKKTYQSQ